MIIQMEMLQGFRNGGESFVQSKNQVTGALTIYVSSLDRVFYQTVYASTLTKMFD